MSVGVALYFSGEGRKQIDVIIWRQGTGLIQVATGDRSVE